jgi:hypothetical protein
MLIREEGYKLKFFDPVAVSTIAVAFPYDKGTYLLQNVGSQTIFMGNSSGIGTSTGTWNLTTGIVLGPVVLSSENYFIATSLQSMKLIQYIY